MPENSDLLGTTPPPRSRWTWHLERERGSSTCQKQCVLGDVENISTCYSKNHQGSRENAPRLRFARHDPSTQEQMDMAPRKGERH